jgi:hypothetical protein
MSDRIEWFQASVPALTPVITPYRQALVFPFGNVVEIDVKVPPGPAGNVGFYITAGGSQYIPRTSGTFIIPDSDYFTWPLANAINSGSWGIVAYNTDVWPHLIEVGFLVNEVTYSPTPTFGAPLSL